MTAPLTPPSSAPPDSSEHPRQRPAWRVAALQAVVVVVGFGAAGAGCGWLWYRLWDAPSGVVSGGQWYTSEAGLRDDFQGVAWYVVIAVTAGLVLGILASWLLARSELVTLVAVVAGSVLAAYLMLRVGTHLSPADPHDLARHAKDGTRLKGDLQVTSWSPRGAFPFGALLGLAFVYLVSVGRTSPGPTTEPQPGLGGPYAASPQRQR